MLARNIEEQEKVDSLVVRFVTGEISETVFQVSLHRYIDVDDIKMLVSLNRLAHQNSLNYRRGIFT